jgi:hypothetical protein
MDAATPIIGVATTLVAALVVYKNWLALHLQNLQRWPTFSVHRRGNGDGGILVTLTFRSFPTGPSWEIREVRSLAPETVLVRRSEGGVAKGRAAAALGVRAPISSNANSGQFRFFACARHGARATKAKVKLGFHCEDGRTYSRVIAVRPQPVDAKTN